MLSLRIDAGLELVGFALAAAAAIAARRGPRRGPDRAAVVLLLLAALMVGVAALPHLRAAFAAA
jgi:hypothetical protein